MRGHGGSMKAERFETFQRRTGGREVALFTKRASKRPPVFPTSRFTEVSSLTMARRIEFRAWR